MNRQQAFDQLNETISQCDYATAISVLVSLLTFVAAHGPGDTVADIDANIDRMVADMKARVRQNWHRRMKVVH